MSFVTAHVIGGQKKLVESVETVGDVRAKLGISANYAAAVNGEAAKDDNEVLDGQYVTFAEAVKGN